MADQPSAPRKRKHEYLGSWLATAICGNDILSSTLYVSGIAALFAGIYAPLVLLAVAGVLFLYRFVYREVVEALPINGGAYNCLLNATSKSFAAIAGVLTILSYIATAVISAKVGIEYVHSVIPVLPVIPATIGLLFTFALLIISGVKDSARVALIIFLFHIATLSLFLIFGGWFLFFGGISQFIHNGIATQLLVVEKGSLLAAFFLAFSASLLGVSGFESSANFVEEQATGVFAKTLRNMWILVSIFNPLIAAVVIASMPLAGIAAAKDFLLADAARLIGGSYFGYLIVADAFLVLSGAVLTSFVGVSGLMHRMALDECIPGILLSQTKRGSHPRIVMLFFFLCSSILLLTGGELLSLAGVYTISFLAVMSLFALGNIVLKETRTELKRPYRAPAFISLIAFLATAAGIGGNIIIDPRNLYFFSLYFIPTLFIVFSTMHLDLLFRFLLRIAQEFSVLGQFIRNRYNDLLQGHYVVFIHTPDRLYSALSYINRNEFGNYVTIVCCRDEDKTAAESREMVRLIKELVLRLRQAGAFPHFNIDVHYNETPFSPTAIRQVSRELKVHHNRIMIGSIHHYHDFDYHELGGVRIFAD